MLDYNEKVVPVDIMAVGNTMASLASDLASGITGEVIYVDADYHRISMGGIE